MNRWCGLILALTLVVGCSTLSEEEQARVDAAQEQAEEFGNTGDPLADLSDEQRQCFDEGTSDLDVAEVVADASTSGDAARAELYRVLIDCVPDITEVDSLQTTLTNNFSAGIGVEISAAEGRCIVGYIVDNSSDPGRTIGDGSAVEDAEVAAAGIQECLTPENLDAVFGAAGTGPQSYGDDEYLDALYDECADGSDEACDLLFVDSVEGSEYRALAQDCARRGNGIDWCTDGMEANEFGAMSAPAALVSRLFDECDTGNMTSCDLLDVSAELGSPEGAFGSTCGERIVGAALPNCRTRFGVTVTD